MCVSDYKVGRLIRVERQSLTVVVGTPQTILPNKDRVFIQFLHTMNNSTGHIEVTDTANNALLWRANSVKEPLFWDMRSFGDLPTRGFTLSALTANVVVGVVQGFLPEMMLTELLEKYLETG